MCPGFAIINNVLANAPWHTLCTSHTSLFEGYISRTGIGWIQRAYVVFNIGKIFKILFYTLQVILSIEGYYS